MSRILILSAILGLSMLTGPSAVAQPIVLTQTKISSNENGFERSINRFSGFGSSISAIGDLDGDGKTDLAVGIMGDDANGVNGGAYVIFFMNEDNTVASHVLLNGFSFGERKGVEFGHALAPWGDWDDNPETAMAIVVGAPGENDDGSEIRENKGAVHLAYHRTDGSLESLVTITEGNGLPTGTELSRNGRFGHAVALLPDLDSNGVPDLAVGAPLDHEVATRKGAVYILFMNADGSVKALQKISDNEGTSESLELQDFSGFGSSLASLGDLDGDGLHELAVGAPYWDTSAGAYDENSGAVFILSLNNAGRATGVSRFDAESPTLALADIQPGDLFGRSLARAGLLNLDDIPDLAVGATHADVEKENDGAVYLLFMDNQAQVTAIEEMASSTNGISDLGNYGFGGSLAGDVDFNNDGLSELLVGHPELYLLDRQYSQEGALWIFGLDRSSPALPVELTLFDGRSFGNMVTLNWETASELNNAGFEVQMKEADSWSDEGFVEGHGTSSEAHAYAYTLAVEPGTHTFRLKQVDFDGTTHFSEIIDVTVGVAGSHHVTPGYPNPFNPQTRFNVVVPESQHVRIAAYNVLGQEVALLHDGLVDANKSYAIGFDASQLPSGYYIVRFQGEQFLTARQVLLLK